MTEEWRRSELWLSQRTDHIHAPIKKLSKLRLLWKTAKRADGVPLFIIEPSPVVYNNFPASFPNKLHYMDTNLNVLNQNIINRLLFSLKFISYPAHQHKGVTSTFTVYLKTGKELIYEVAEEASFRAIRHHNDNLWDTKEQQTFHRML
jgi:hypothetical protein